MESKDLREFYKMPDNVTGILVTRIAYGCDAWNKVKVGDVVTAINGIDISNDSTIEFRKGERVFYSYVYRSYQNGDSVTLDILRDGKPITLKIKLNNIITQTVEGPLYDVEPSYYVVGGIFFTKLTTNYLGTWGKYTPTRFKYYNEHKVATKTKKEVVILEQILAHDVSVGYHNYKYRIVEDINGVTINALADVVRAFKKPIGKYHIIKLDYDSENSKQIILNAKKIADANQEILDRFKIAKDRSDDLKDI
jgi:hypothetical protein